jgi:DNA-binding MarR family transcriptional regulator
MDTVEPVRGIGFLVRRCGALMTRVASRRFGSESISFIEWIVLATLDRYEHLSATMLSDEIGYDIGALTRIVDGLESEGLVWRERSKRDRRTVEIALTSRGLGPLQGGKRVFVDLLNELATPYTHRERKTLIRLMQRLLLRLQQAQTDEQPGMQPAAPEGRGRSRRTSSSSQSRG